jgi:hypothetical protein
MPNADYHLPESWQGGILIWYVPAANAGLIFVLSVYRVGRLLSPYGRHFDRNRGENTTLRTVENPQPLENTAF